LPWATRSPWHRSSGVTPEISGWNRGRSGADFLRFFRSATASSVTANTNFPVLMAAATGARAILDGR